MAGILWRVLVAIVAVVTFLLIFPALMRILGVPVGGDLELIVNVVVAALALYYILKGPPVL